MNKYDPGINMQAVIQSVDDRMNRPKFGLPVSSGHVYAHLLETIERAAVHFGVSKATIGPAIFRWFNGGDSQ